MPDDDVYRWPCGQPIELTEADRHMIGALSVFSPELGPEFDEETEP